MSELITVTIDDREVEVAKGTGLVETAAAAGIEIPVFCYEPRLGPPVGACRMCLVEVEGLPKLQAGCTLSAQEGMVVRTSPTSERAAEGQNGTLEFILVNHPLDCPVCDKGGECPLQDLDLPLRAGSTRMTFPKMTFDKPIPVSPLIALDRERCILCYRCTRFSGEVAEDNQLIARNRGAYTEIATFEEDPYRAPFSGNVIELCPVGALTSTQYRFEARPWEIQEVPTTCGLCPVGCSTRVTTREGAVRRVQSRNHPEVDGGWLCDKGRFSFPYLRAQDRVREPLVRGELGLEPVSWDAAPRPGRVAAPWRGPEHRDRALRLGDDGDRATASPCSCAAGSARTRPCSTSRPRPHSTPSGPALDDRERGARRGRRGRRGRRPRAGHRPLDPACAPAGGGDRHDRRAGNRAGGAWRRRRGAAGARRRRERASNTRPLSLTGSVGLAEPGRSKPRRREAARGPDPLCKGEVRQGDPSHWYLDHDCHPGKGIARAGRERRAPCD